MADDSNRDVKGVGHAGWWCIYLDYMVGQPGEACSWDDKRVTAWEHQLQTIQGRRNEGMCLIRLRINEVDTVAGGQWGRGGGQERRSGRNRAWSHRA